MAVVGESGSGKSVMTMSLIRLIGHPGRIVDGEVLFNGEDVIGYSDDRLRALRGGEAGVVFQDPMTSLNPVMRVQDQLIAPMRRHLKIGRTETQARVVELLRQVGIPSPEARARAYPHELSGGMRQRVLIAMALACNPKLLIADEPTTALDVTIQAQVLDLMNSLRTEFKTAILFITHDLGVIANMVDDVVVMYLGRIVEGAPVRQIFHDPKHPYTHGLMNSIPSLTSTRKERLTPIEGIVPDSFEIPQGCGFEPRCPHAMEICRNQIPQLKEVAPGHLAACWLFE
jgi:oligopeptide/dipeptide ABC transporter ATP-binding protein